MRTTAATTYRDSLAAIERASTRLLEYQRQVATGRRISRPSDDPAGTATAIRERGDVARAEQYSRTSDSATSRLTVVDSALSDIIEQLTHAQVSVVSAQGTEKTPAQREVAAQALESVRDAIAGDLNTSFQGSYLFAGADSTNPPFVIGSGGTVSPYQGSTREVAVDIDTARSATIGIDGSTISQGAAAADVFSVLDAAISKTRELVQQTGEQLEQKIADVAEKVAEQPLPPGFRVDGRMYAPREHGTGLGVREHPCTRGVAQQRREEQGSGGHPRVLHIISPRKHPGSRAFATLGQAERTHSFDGLKSGRVL